MCRMLGQVGVSDAASTDTRSGTVGPQQTGEVRKVKDPRKERKVPDPRVPGKGTTKVNMKKVGKKERESRGETPALGETQRSTSTNHGNSQAKDGPRHRGKTIGMGTRDGTLVSGQRKKKGRRPRAKEKEKEKAGAECRK